MAKLLMFTLVFSLFISCGQKVESSGTAVSMVNENDRAMNQAIKESKRTLPLFIERFKSPVAGDSSFIVKVMVKEANGIEHLWVRDLTITDSVFSGIVDNEPQFVTSVKCNGTISFTSKDISDWAYTDSTGVRQGSFTIKILLSAMPSQDATAYRDMFGWDDTVGSTIQKDSVQ